MNIKNPTFGGFKPDAMSRIAKTLGYEGEMSGFQQYLDQNPDKRTQMDQFKQAAMMMAKGGSVQKFQVGGTPTFKGTDFKDISAEEAGFKAPTGPATQAMEVYYNPTTQQKVTVGSGGYEVPEGFIKGNLSGYQDQPQSPINYGNQSNLYSQQTAAFNQANQKAIQTANATGNAQQNAMLAQQTATAAGNVQLQQPPMETPTTAPTPMSSTQQQQGFFDTDLTDEQRSTLEGYSAALDAKAQEYMAQYGKPQDQAAGDAMNKYMQGLPEYQQMQQYQQGIAEQLKDTRGGGPVPLPDKGIDDGIPPIARPPEEDIIAPSPEQPKPPSSEKLPQLIQTPQGSFNATVRVVTQADGTSRQQYTIKDSKGLTVATLTGSAELADWMQQNEGTSYDPSQGMPEPLPEEFITGFTADQPDWAKTGLTEMFKSGKLPEDPTDFTSESLGNRRHKITYKDGTTLEVGPIGKFDTEPDTIRTTIANKINEFKNSPEYTNNKAQQDAYRNYITEQTTGGVTGDIENIEEEYTNATNTYKQQQLELERLQKQAEANPDDPYLKQLVEEKGKEVSDSFDRIQQLQPLYQETQKTIEDVMAERATDPTLPEGAKVTPSKIETSPDQFIAEGTGGLEGDISYDPVKGEVTTAEGVEQPETVTYDATLVTDKAKAELDKVKAATLDEFSKGVIFEGEQGELSDKAYADEALKVATDRIQKVNENVNLEVTSQQLAEVKGKNLKAIEAKVAKSSALLDAVAQAHVVQPNELPTPQLIAEEDMAQARAMTDTGLDKDAIPIAAKMASFSVDNGTLAKAAQGDVDSLATVEGQLGKLMKQFDDGTPSWAAGAIRAANAVMSARGLGTSSMAGAAILQAAIESALPIAQADAKTYADMGLKNLDNRQQIAISNAAAQQGLQLQNLDNEQKANLQKSINAFGLQTQNLSNRQASEVANAQIRATLQGQNLTNMQQSNIATAARFAEAANINLNNKQQAAMQDNTNALQTNLAELSAAQSAYITSANLAAALQGQVLSNEQQVAISNAARYSEAANIEFTAQQQNAIHNSKLMQTIGLAELSATQAATLQNAAQVASMDLANLNNRQQAAVQNAKAFLEKDLTNLNNEQQMAVFKAQATQQALLSDQAAENAAKQFNAQSENQANQFYDNLTQQNNQFNAAQANTMEMANVDAENAALEFAANMKNNREQYESSNEVVIAQSNVTWRREIATEDTAAINRSNEINAINTLDISNQAYDNMWNQYGDQMEWAINSYESEADRVSAHTLEVLRQEGNEKAAKYAADAKASSAIGGAVVNLLTADAGVIGGLFD